MFEHAAHTGQAEGMLFAQLEAALGGRSVDPAALERPLRVIVPSRSLRDHLSRTLLARLGGAQLGLVVQTHYAAALEVLETSGEAAPRGDALLPLWVDRLARRDNTLRAALGAFREGFGAVAVAVRDLLDAGYRPHHEVAAQEALVGVGSRAERERAAAVLRVAAQACRELESAGLGERSTLFERAEARLLAGGRDAFPSTGIWIYGFADATGVLADWLAALVRQFEARILVELPLDPADPARREARYANFFVERLAERLGTPAPRPRAAPPQSEPPSWSLVEAPGAAAELRAVAVRIRALLDAGVEPEEIGVVARSFDAYRAFLRAEFERLGIPASTRQVGGYSRAGGRRCTALRVLLERRGGAPIDAWLGADAGLQGGEDDLRLALHTVGATHLAVWVELALRPLFARRNRLGLPVRVDAQRPLELGFPELRDAQSRARRLLGHLDAWPERAPASHHAAHIDALIDMLALRQGVDLGLHPRGTWTVDVPGEIELTREEASRLLFEFLDDATHEELLGSGGGVQVMTVMAARGRRFAELFMIGMNRDVFPRPIAADPLMPDPLRRTLQTLLPDLPVKTRGRDEERHLFASLCLGSPRCTFSWSTLSEEGRELAVSPLIARLELARPDLRRAVAPPLRSAVGPGARGLASALERATHAALVGGGAALAPLWSTVLGERARDVSEFLGDLTSPSDRHAVADALAALLRAFEQNRSPKAKLSPFLGLVEAAQERADAREPELPFAPLFITRLDQLLRCPWQHFLRRELRVEPVPDALAELPSATPRLRGTLVHRVLQRIVEEQFEELPGDLEAALRQGPQKLRWPELGAFEALVERCAEDVAQAEGLRDPGFVRLLARSVRGELMRARTLEWEGDAATAVFGAELLGSFLLQDRAGRVRRLHFRADRVDRRGGRLSFSEYKTGRVFARGKEPETRARNLAAMLREGEGLQLPAYLAAGAELVGLDGASARLVFLRAGAEEADRVTTLVCSDTRLTESFRAAAGAALEALDHGVRVPRLVDRDPGREPERCASCEVSLACLRGESGHRLALAQWREKAMPRSAAERVAAELLGGRRPPTPRRKPVAATP